MSLESWLKPFCNSGFYPKWKHVAHPHTCKHLWTEKLNTHISITSVPQTSTAPYRWKWVKTKALMALLEPSKSKWKFQRARRGNGSHSKRSSALLTTQGQRSQKDYTADCQRGVQSSGLRNLRIRVQGLGVWCPTRDKTETPHINRGGCFHTTGAEMKGHPHCFIYSVSYSEGLHPESREQRKNDAWPVFVNIYSKQLSMQ